MGKVAHQIFLFSDENKEINEDLIQNQKSFITQATIFYLEHSTYFTASDTYGVRSFINNYHSFVIINESTHEHFDDLSDCIEELKNICYTYNHYIRNITFNNVLFQMEIVVD